MAPLRAALRRQGVDFDSNDELRIFLAAHARGWELNVADPPISLCEVSATIARALADLL
jgi:hypothetical protein